MKAGEVCKELGGEGLCEEMDFVTLIDEAPEGRCGEDCIPGLLNLDCEDAQGHEGRLGEGGANRSGVGGKLLWGGGGS